MMKKILSMLMAVAMIVSLLPLSVFAADEEIKCPGQELHNLTNCDWTEGTTVAPACGKHGYTLYECNACHVSFAGNFVAPIAEHKWVVDTEAKAPTCTDDGTFVAEKCELCGTPKPGTGAVDPATGHAWTTEPVSGNCVDGYVYECTACGEKETRPTTENGHVWCEIPTIIEEPQAACRPGKAEYTCTVAGCDAKKVVDIQNEECKLEAKTGKGATCTEDGIKDHFQCKICGRLYLVQGGDAVEAADLVIPATGHAKAEQWTKGEKLTDWSCTTDETYAYECPNCDATEPRVTKEADHDYWPTPILHKDPTCTEWGYTTYGCKRCNYSYTESADPLGHTELNRATASIYVEPTCSKDGYAVWNCERCGEEQNKTLTCEGHDEFIKTVTVPATCSKYAYTFTYCSREVTSYGYTSNYCDSADLLNQWPVDKWTVDGVDYSVLVNGQPVFLLSIEIDVAGGYDADNHTEDPARSFWVEPGKEADCETSAYKMVYCLDCEYAAIELKEAWGHHFEIVIYDGCGRPTVETSGVLSNGDTYHVTFDENYKPSAYANRTVDVRCTNPNCVIAPVVGLRSDNKFVGGCYDGQKIEAVFGTTLMRSSHNKNGITLDPVTGEPFTTGTPCTGITGYKYCDECGRGGGFKAPGVPANNHIKYTVSAAVPYDPFNIYSSFEDLLAVHPNATLYGVHEQGDCLHMGVYNYYCADCEKYHPVAIPGTGTHAPVENGEDWADLLRAMGANIVGNPTDRQAIDLNINGVVWKSPTVPTCVEDGRTAAYVCPTCGTYVESQVIPCVGEHNIVIDVEAVAPDCINDGHSGSSHCTECDEVTIVGQVLPATGHGNWILLDHVLDATCTQFKYNHWACGNPGCDYEFINYYRPALGHEEVTVKVPSTCTTPGLKGCANCTDLDVVIEAGHRNEAGDLIVDACTDTVEDRLCVMCDQTIAKSHTDLQHDEHPATCTQNAYVIEYCDDCDYKQVTEIDGTMAHVAVLDKEASIAATYHAAGLDVYVCKFCGKIMEEKVVDILTGVGIMLDVDNAVKPGETLADSSLVAITVTLDANKVDVWGLKFNVNFDNKVLKFEKAEFVSDQFISLTTVGAPENGSYVTVMANTANTIDGKMQNYTIDAEHVLVTLYFRVVSASAVEDSVVSVSDTDLITYVEGKAVSVEATGYTATFDVEKFMDLDRDGDVNMADAMYAYQIASTNGEYDAVIDIDKDGEITMTDCMYLYYYQSGMPEFSYDEIVKIGVNP